MLSRRKRTSETIAMRRFGASRAHGSGWRVYGFDHNDQRQHREACGGRAAQSALLVETRCTEHFLFPRIGQPCDRQTDEGRPSKSPDLFALSPLAARREDCPSVHRHSAANRRPKTIHRWMEIRLRRRWSSRGRRGVAESMPASSSKSARRAPGGSPEQSRAALEVFVRRIRAPPFDLDDAWDAAEIRAELEAKGTPIGAYDCLIATQARRRGARLVTSNTRSSGRRGCWSSTGLRERGAGASAGFAHPLSNGSSSPSEEDPAIQDGKVCARGPGSPRCARDDDLKSEASRAVSVVHRSNSLCDAPFRAK